MAASCDPLKKRRGGVLQRLQADAKESQTTSSLATYLLTEYAWGHMSVQQVQEIASLAISDFERASDGLSFPDLLAMSKFGSSGAQKANMSRDMSKYIASVSNLPPASMIDLPTKHHMDKVAMIMPHELFAELYENHRQAFFKTMMPQGSHQPKAFWDQCAGMQCLQGQPALGKLDRLKAIPPAMHGDEVPIAGRGKTWVKLSVVFTWFSALTSGLSTKEALMWIWACPPSLFDEGDHGALATFWECMAWSFTCLFTGKWPERDHRNMRYPAGSKEARRAGTPLAGGYYGVMVGLIGDLDYCTKFLKLPHWASSKEPCSRCKATKSGSLTWKDSRLVAPWRATVYTPSTWLAHPARSTCPIFEAPNITAVSVQPDLMHIKYLGYQQYFFGSVLWLLCFRILPAGPKANLRRIGLFIAWYQKRNPCSAKYSMQAFQKLTIFQRKKGCPKLKGKGSQIRHIAPALAAFWSRHMSGDDIIHRRVALVFKLDAEVDKILDEFSPQRGFYSVPHAEYNHLRNKQIALSQLFLQLEEHFSASDVPLFNVVSKLHYCQHCYDDAKDLHPYLMWCWRGEDFMNVASTLLSSCLRGRQDMLAVSKAAEKYRLGMFLSWKKVG